MTRGILTKIDHLEIVLDASQEITSANPLVFEPEHQEESKFLIAESEFLRDAQNRLAELLKMGRPEFVSITEPDRQCTFRFLPTEGSTISLSRVHREIVRSLPDKAANPS